MTRFPRKILATALGCLALAAPAVRAQPEDAWSHLATLRRALEAPAPTAATFQQNFVPAGFTDGEQETGTVAFDLPECLRWDYDEPFPKSYLLCGHTAWSWNRDEASGRRHIVAEEDEGGLDLLRLNLEQLRERYRASAQPAAGGGWRVRLEPLDRQGPVLGAELLIDAGGDRLAALSYHDREGNLTRFTFSDYQAVSGSGLFEPPAGLVWLTQ